MINLRCRFHDKDVSEFSRAIRGVADAMTDFSPLFEIMIGPISAAISQNFQQQGNYYERWAALKAKYKAWKIARGYSTRILEMTGAMRDAATRRGAAANICAITPKRFVWGIDDSAIPYAIYHDSDKPRRKIPRREFMVLNEETVYKTINRAIGDYVRRSGLPTGVYRR